MKKGFTLIELLAVIVILSIIALIATPIILNVVEKASKNSFKVTCTEVYDAYEKYIFEEEINGNSEICSLFDF